MELGEAPKEVETVVNYRIINQRTFVAGVSGGVRVQPAALVKPQAIEVEAIRSSAEPAARRRAQAAADDRWWWD